MSYIPKCTNYRTCSNHPFMCFECLANQCGTVCYYEAIKSHHYEKEKDETVSNNQKLKIFFGTYSNQADVQLNEWLEDNPNVTIINYQYQQARMGDHSICVMYKDR